jgi:aminomethyltransferase
MPVEATLLRTPLYARHVDLGARMVPFAGYEMPVQYEGVIPEHKAVRTDAGAFDVSHMGEIHVDGPTAQAFLQAMLSNDIDKLSDGDAQYTLLTNETGGIVDDLIAYRLGHGQFYLVVNASNRAAVYGRLKEREPRGCEVRDASDDYGLVAVQGPRSLERLGLPDAPAFTHAMGDLAGIDVMVARTGYTGEQGVELCCAEDDAVALWDAIRERGAMETTSRPRPTRSPPAWAGRVRSTPTSPEWRRCAGSKRRGPLVSSPRSSWRSAPFRARGCRSRVAAR